jgi:hypothetical protein
MTQQLQAQQQATCRSQAVADALRTHVSSLQQALAEMQAGSSIQESQLQQASKQCSLLYQRVSAQRQAMQTASKELSVVRSALHIQPGESAVAALARLKSQNIYNKSQQQQLRQRVKSLEQQHQQLSASLSSSTQQMQKEFGDQWQCKLRQAISVYEQRVVAADQLSAAKAGLQQELAAARHRAAAVQADYRALQQQLLREASSQQQRHEEEALAWKQQRIHLQLQYSKLCAVEQDLQAAVQKKDKQLTAFTQEIQQRTDLILKLQDQLLSISSAHECLCSEMLDLQRDSLWTAAEGEQGEGKQQQQGQPKLRQQQQQLGCIAASGVAASAAAGGCGAAAAAAAGVPVLLAPIRKVLLAPIRKAGGCLSTSSTSCKM